MYEKKKTQVTMHLHVQKIREKINKMGVQPVETTTKSYPALENKNKNKNQKYSEKKQ